MRSIDTLVDIIGDDLDACPDRDLVRECETIGDGYHVMPLGRPGAGGATLFWWIDSFVQCAEERRRIWRSLLAVDRYFSKLEGLEGGRRVPTRIREGLKREIVHAMFPTAREIVSEARIGAPARAKANLFRFIGEPEWRMRSSF